MAKKAKKESPGAKNKGTEKRERQGPAVALFVQHKQLQAEAAKLVAVANAVQTILHSSASEEERSRLAAFIRELNNTVLATARIPCPNPMYNRFTIDGDKIGALPVLEV